MAKRTERVSARENQPQRPAGAAPNFDMARMMGSFALPKVDLETMATAQRRNIEAMTAVCQLAFDCVQVSAQRQAELFRETAEEVVASFRNLSGQGAPQDQAASQAEIGRKAFEKGLVSLRELAELIAKSNSEAFGIINKRASGCMDELQRMVRQDGKEK